MSGFGILFLIFATCVFLTGLFMFTGHKIGMLEWRAAFKGLDKDGWKNIGKWTMITSIFIYIIAILAIVFNIE
jgi:hypothetical protein